jgi:hypothetical protein
MRLCDDEGGGGKGGGRLGGGMESRGERKRT